MCASTRSAEAKANRLQFGRFIFLDGSEIAPKNATLATLKRDRVSQRLLGDFGLSDVGRSFDGVHYSFSTPSNDFTFVAAVPTRGVFQVDGWGWNQVGFGYAAYTHEWGSGRHAADTRFFVLEYDDWRPHSEDRQPPAWPCAKADTENIRHRDVRRPQPARLHHERGHRRSGRLGRRADRPLGNRAAARLRIRFRERLAAQHSAGAEAVAAGGVHGRIRRRQSQRQHAWNVLPGAADATPLRALPVLQHDEHARI